ncbi:MAG: phosphatidate cytidylyltransferase [Planctomycetes bacterium]|nr:phosphatidate cytidylyltransferase [Planctomycetota bacterium]
MTTIPASGPAKGRSELKTRLVFGPLLLVLVGLCYYADLRWSQGYLSAGVLGLLGMAGLHEYVVMLRRAGFAVAADFLYPLSAALFVSAFFFQWHSIDHELYPLAIGTILLLFPIATRSLLRDHMAKGLEEQGASLLGFVMIAWTMFLAQGMAIRHTPSVLYVVLVCKGGDIGAYFAGIALGRRKMIPHVSPGKTWEGAAGSLAASCALAVLLRPWLLQPEVDLGLTAAVGVGIMLNVTTQVGDLIESLMKRRCGVKDSSALLPAHGGVLDLVDSLLFSFPAFFLVLCRLT